MRARFSLILIPTLLLAGAADAQSLRERWRAKLAQGQQSAPGGRSMAYGRDALQTLDFWPGATAKAPLILFVHGGGWKRGSKDNATGAAKVSHYNGLGYAFASINYRLVPDATVEQQAQDVADALAYLRTIAQPADDLAFERIYNQPKRGLGAKTLEAMRRHARRMQAPLAAASLDLCETDELPTRARNSLVGLLGQFVHWREMAETVTPSELLRTVLAESGYEEMLQKDRSPESAGRLENLTELARAMEEYETLGDFLEHVSLVMDNDRADDGEKVTIMTMHAAKGLEFDHVFLPGWEEGVFPSQRAIDEGGLASLEEERRLAYVAITRAKRRCTILHAANRRIYGQWTSSIPSRFIEELPEEQITSETTMTGGASLWRANWTETEDPFAHVSSNRPERSGARGPGWQRALSTGYDATPKRLAEPGRSAASFAAKPRSDIAIGARVFHDKFGYGCVTGQEGNKLTIEFEKAGEKRVLDSFVKLAD